MSDPLLDRLDALVERIDRMCGVIELLMMDATGIEDEEAQPEPARYMDGTLVEP